MATNTEVDQALSEAIVSIAKSASKETDSIRALRFAAAANQLAEAKAWNSRPAQPHGGGVQVPTE